MIVLRQANTLRIVCQPDHAAMAAQIARAWRRPGVIPPTIWERFLDAVAHHDDGWIAAEKKPALDDDGRPFDFKQIPSDQHLAIWRRSVDLASRLDAYAGLLVAHHARYLYTHTTVGNDDNQAAAQGFINELAVRIVRSIEPLDLGDADERAASNPRHVNVARRLLTALDWLSLGLLGGLAMPPATEPLAFGDTEHPLAIAPTDAGATVTPWPFDVSAVSIGCDAVEVPDVAYPSPRALAEAMAAAPPRPLCYQLTRGD